MLTPWWTQEVLKNKLFERRRKLTKPYIHVKASARSCSVHYHSHGILVLPILMQLQSNMRDDKYRRVGCWGHRLRVLAQVFYADNTLHTLLPTSSGERTCGGWAVSHWTHLWRCSLFKLNSRNLARARCRTWFLPQALPALWVAHRSKRGINHLHKTHRYDKAWWNLIAPNTNLTILPTNYT